MPKKGYKQTEEHRNNEKKPKSEEAKKNMSRGKLEYFKNSKNPRLGTHPSEETLQKMRKPKTEEQKEQIRNTLKGRHNSVKTEFKKGSKTYNKNEWKGWQLEYLKNNFKTMTSRQMSEIIGKSKDCINHKLSAMGLKRENNFWAKFSCGVNNPMNRQEVKEKQHKTINSLDWKERVGNEYHKLQGEKIKNMWADPNSVYHTIEFMDKYLKGLTRKPTSFEEKISKLCLKYNLPFIYVGDGRMLIGYKSPDFINEKEKIVIEVFYNYFKIRDYGSIENYIKERGEHFAKYGYETIFIREEEIRDKKWEDICLSKIKSNCKEVREWEQ